MKRSLRLGEKGVMALNRPPLDFNTRKVRLVGTPPKVVRLSKRKHLDPLFWSKEGIYRFDSKSAPYGVLYTAKVLKAAILEVWGDRWFEQRYLDRIELEEYNCYTISIRPRARVADCTGDHLSLLGTDSNFFATTDYGVTQEWGRALMNHPAKAEGLEYHSRKNPELRNFALFDKPATAAKLNVVETVPLILHPGLFDILGELQVDLI
jgi:hypothetical protein